MLPKLRVPLQYLTLLGVQVSSSLLRVILWSSENKCKNIDTHVFLPISVKIWQANFLACKKKSQTLYIHQNNHVEKSQKSVLVFFTYSFSEHVW